MVIFLIIWLLVFAFISWHRQELGIYLVVFSLPCYLLRSKIFGFPIPSIDSGLALSFIEVPTTVLELEIYVLFLALLIRGILNSDQRAIYFKKIKSLFIVHCSLFIAISLVLMGAILSTVFSSDLRVSAGIFKGWFFDPLIFSIIVFCALKTKKQVEILFSSLTISGAIVAIIGIFYYFSRNLTFDGRLRAFYLSPNHLAMYLAPCFVVAVCLMAIFQKRATRFLLGMGLILIGWAIYLTYSYGAWLGILGALFFSALVFLRGKRRIFCFFAILFFIVFLLFLQAPSFKFQNLIESSRSSFQSRLMVWQAAFAMAEDHFFWGIGPGMFQKYYLDYQKYFPPYLEWAAPQPHSLFLAFWLQTGIFGLIGFLWLLFWFFRTGFQLLKIENLKLKIILMAIMIYTLVHGLIDTTYWKNDLSLVFWLIIFLMAGARRLKPD